MAYEILDSKQVYTGKIINVLNDTITLPNGKDTVREIVVHGGASAVIPIDSDGNILFVRQYRHAAYQQVLEIPAGTLEAGEDALVCAKRELEEETGFFSDDLTHLSSMYIAIGYSTEIIHIYLAQNLQKGNLNLDDEEFISIEKFSFDESIEKVFKGEIVDSKTIAAIFMAKHLLK